MGLFRFSTWTSERLGGGGEWQEKDGILHSRCETISATGDIKRARAKELMARSLMYEETR